MRSSLAARVRIALCVVGVAVVSAGCAGLPAASGEPVLAIVGGTVVDGTGAPPRANTTVLVRGDRIVAVGAASVPRGATVIDAHGKTVMPGLIESNGHVTFSGQIDHAAYFARQFGRLHDVGVRNLGLALDQGITTIRDTYGPLGITLKLRDEARAGSLVGSRLYVAGPIVNYISVLDLPTTVPLDPADVKRAREQLDVFTLSGDAAVAAVRRIASAGADFIKISADTGPEQVPPDLGAAELKRAVAEAHSLGLRTTSHTVSLATLANALDAGFDALEHPELVRRSDPNDPLSDDLPAATAAEIARRGIYSIPLITAVEVYVRAYDDPTSLERAPGARQVAPAMLAEAKAAAIAGAATPAVVADMRQFYDQVRANLATLIAARAPIAMGTDKGTRYNFFESANHVRELQAYVDLGMSPMDALVSATRRGAELLGIQDRLGTLEPGKLADVIVVGGDPLRDLESLRRIDAVVLAGKRVR